MSWVLMVAAGGLLMALMLVTPPQVDWVLERLAACCFVAANASLTSGVLANWAENTTEWSARMVDQASAAVAGVGIAWIVTAFLAIVWIGAMLPNRWIKWRFSNGLIFAGLPLPFLLPLIPGPLGEFLRLPFDFFGELALQLVSSAVA